MNNIISLNNQKFELNLFLQDLSTAFTNATHEVPLTAKLSFISCVALLALSQGIGNFGTHHGSNIVGKYEVYLGLTSILALSIFSNSVRKSYNKAREDRIQKVRQEQITQRIALQKIVIDDFTSQRTSFPDNTRPNMLVLTATQDSNGALSNPTPQGIFLKLDKKFNIVFKKVALISDINENLAENSIIKKIDVLWIRAHGSPSGITLSQSEGSKVKLTISNLNAVADQIKTSLSPQGTIILYSCKTAIKLDEHSESFASTLSSLTDLKVVAANQLLHKPELHTIDPLEVKFLTRAQGSYQDCTVVINPSEKVREENILNM